jgi:hypothetical protein
MREKWDEEHFGDGRTYGQATIATAIEGQTEFFKPSHNRDHHNTSDAVEALTIEDILLIPQRPRRTESGKLIVPIILTRNGKVIDQVTVTDATSSRTSAVKQIAVHARSTDKLRKSWQSCAKKSFRTCWMTPQNGVTARLKTQKSGATPNTWVHRTLSERGSCGFTAIDSLSEQ